MNTFWQASSSGIISSSGPRPAAHHVIAAANLPAPLAHAVADIVNHTRLRAGERADLAAELCAHFADGLAAGLSPETLLKDFGDPRTAARLITRAVKRKRGRGYRIFRRVLLTLALTVTCLLLTYAWLFIQYNFRKPTIARNYAAEFNARIESVPLADRAWPKYEAILPVWVHPSKELRDAYPPEPSSPLWNEAVENLRANAANLEAIRKAADLPGWGVGLRREVPQAIADFDQIEGVPSISPVDMPQGVDASNPPLLYTNLPQLHMMRIFARALRCDMASAALNRDGALITRDMRTILGLARQLREQRVLISDLVAAAVAEHGYIGLSLTLHDHPEAWNQAQLIELAHVLAAYPGQGDNFRIRFDAERLQFDDILQRTYSDDGRGDGRILADAVKYLDSITAMSEPKRRGISAVASRFVGPAAAGVIAGRREIRDIYNSFLDRADKLGATPLWERGESVSLDFEVEMMAHSGWSQVRYMPISILLPAVGSAAFQGEIMQAHHDAMLVAVALEIYNRRHDAYPATLDALVPSLLPSIPPDRYTGTPLLYTLKDNKPVLYSVGADRTDNHGVPPPGENGNLFARRFRTPAEAKAIIAAYPQTAVPQDIRGDWILYPEVP